MHQYIIHLNELVRQGKITVTQKHEMLKKATVDFFKSMKFYTK